MVNGNMYIIFSNAFVSELGDSMVDILFFHFADQTKCLRIFVSSSFHSNCN